MEASHTHLQNVERGPWRFVVHATVICMLLIAGLPGISWTAPPKVIEAIPDNGDTNVNPSLKKIRVTFDQDMKQAGYSWVGGGETFPKMLGQPRWIDARTCEMPVDLEPNHDYWLSINSPTYRNFVGKNDEPAEPYPISFQTGPGDGSPAPKPENPRSEESYAELKRAIDENYSYRDFRKVDWGLLFNDYAPRLQGAASPREFAKTATELLKYANDPHIWLKLGNATFGTSHREILRNYNMQTLSRIVPEWTQRSEYVITGLFPDEIGYVLISTWSVDQPIQHEAEFEALEDFAYTKGLIVDVRPNGGGDEMQAQFFAGCFIEEPCLYAKNVYRSPDSPTGFTDPYDRIFFPKKGRPKYRQKVAVLTGQAVMSSCESFLLMMKQVPNSRLFGDRSYGSSGNPRAFALPNGVTVYLPSWQDMRPDGTVFEGEGIAPDVVISASAEDFENGDLVLEAALKYLRE